MNENEIGGIVVECAVKVHMRLGPGLLETVYEAVLSRLSDKKVGYLLNFGEALMKDGISRIINGKLE
ncbi:MAG: GxxExxY protein [Pseudomonadota bacterium]